MAPAWAQLMDPRGFFAPFGPTTAERRHPGFKLSYEGHECQMSDPAGFPCDMLTVRRIVLG